MNNNLEVMREMLLAVEREDAGTGVPLSKDQLGFSEIIDPLYNRYVILLDRAELLVTAHEVSGFFHTYLPIRLTEAGREFLNNIRDEKRWDRIMSISHEEASTLNLSVLVALADRVVQMSAGKKES